MELKRGGIGGSILDSIGSSQDSARSGVAASGRKFSEVQMKLLILDNQKQWVFEDPLKRLQELCASGTVDDAMVA